MNLKHWAIAAACIAVIGIPASAGWKVEGAETYEPPNPPSATVSISNTRTFDAAPDAVWKAAVAHLSATSFALDQVAKESSLITLSFSVADPEKVLDCGQVHDWVSNMRGKREYRFAGSQALAQYELFGKGSIWAVTRTVTVQGKVNVFFADAGTPESPKVTVRVTARFVPERKAEAHFPLDYQKPEYDTVVGAVTTGEEGKMGGVTCYSTYSLEKSILDGIASSLPTPTTPTP